MTKLVLLPEHVTALAAQYLPVPEPMHATLVLQVAAEQGQRGRRGVMATVVERHGSAPATPGQKVYLGDDGRCVGTVGGGALEREVLQALSVMLLDGGPLAPSQLREFKLGAELGMCCGGRALLLLELAPSFLPCLIVGAGHVATAAAPLLLRLGFAVTVCDARDAWTAEARLPGVTMLLGEYDEVVLAPQIHGVFLAMTHDHSLDQRAIEWALRKGFVFVGGVGSRAKAERTRARLEAKGFSEADRQRVRMPVGVDIGARLPEEIAVAIAAELVAFRRQRALTQNETTDLRNAEHAHGP